MQSELKRSDAPLSDRPKGPKAISAPARPVCLIFNTLSLTQSERKPTFSGGGWPSFRPTPHVLVEISHRDDAFRCGNALFYEKQGKQAQLNQILDEGGKLATIKVKVAKSTPATSSAFVPPNRVAGMRQRIGRNERNTQPTL
ncbi:hypothetical protein PF008_g11049 [Phytophthora fragariae]|uniref:Uncharacterized protein n=1 Tax=Phytophthora fragariae TaxID=53985 RepID=A0A6G0RSH8_9STRA|nr:hypothetical protein PF008_g11049 [Phytophthora fragariae]